MHVEELMQIVETDLHLVEASTCATNGGWGVPGLAERCSRRFPPFLYPLSSSVSSQKQSQDSAPTEVHCFLKSFTLSTSPVLYKNILTVVPLPTLSFNILRNMFTDVVVEKCYLIFI